MITDWMKWAAFALLAVAALVSAFVPVPTDLGGILTDAAKACTAIAGLCLKPPTGNSP